MDKYLITVSGLARDTTESQLRSLFLNCGAIDSVSRNCDGTEAQILFLNEDSACVASMLDGCLLNGCTMSVHFDSPLRFDHHASAKAIGAIAPSDDITICSEPNGTPSPITTAARTAVSGAKLAGSTVASAVSIGACTIAGGVKNVFQGDTKSAPQYGQVGEGFQPQWGANPI